MKNKLKVWYVSYGRGVDRDILKVKATDEHDAIKIAYYQVGPVHNAYPARQTIDKRMIRGMKSMRKQGSSWSDIAWHFRLSTPTIKKYIKSK